MGGMGSGRWGWHQKKVPVEAVPYFLKIGPKGGMEGFMPPGRWTTDMKREGGIIVMVLRGEHHGWERVEEIELAFWKPRFGGKAVWMLCPCCGRRCRKLYAPDGKPFRCRLCYRLTYASVQEAHAFDRGVAAMILGGIAAHAGGTVRDAANALRRR